VCRAPGKLGDRCHLTRPCDDLLGLNCHPGGMCLASMEAVYFARCAAVGDARPTNPLTVGPGWCAAAGSIALLSCTSLGGGALLFGILL